MADEKQSVMVMAPSGHWFILRRTGPDTWQGVLSDPVNTIELDLVVDKAKPGFRGDEEFAPDEKPT